MKRLPLAFVTVTVLLSASWAAGCDSTPSSPTPDPIEQDFQVLYGPLDPLGRSVFIVDIAQAGPIQVMYAGAIVENPLRSVSPVLELGIGDFNDASECVPLETSSTAPKFAAGLHRQMPAGTHCVTVADKLGMSSTVGIVVRIVSPPVLATTGSPGTDTFASTITVGGRATRSIDASGPGTIQLTLGSLLPANPATGLALGLMATDGSGCLLTRIVTVTPGSAPQLSADVEAGPYCMAIFDVGNFASTNTFSATIAHP